MLGGTAAQVAVMRGKRATVEELQVIEVAGEGCGEQP
jgi:hypothetical protein